MVLPFKRSAAAVAVVCALVGGACFAQEAGPQSIVVTGQRGTSAWVRAESAHVVVLSDAPREDVARLVEHLERLDSLLRVYTDDYRPTSAGPESKLNLVYLNDVRDLDLVAADRPANGIALFRDCTDGTQGFLVRTAPLAAIDDDKLVKTPLDEGLSYVSEAYARHFLYRHTDVRGPSAWIEGFANYFAGVRFGATQMVIGRTPPGVGRYFYFLDQGHRYNLDYADILGPRPFANLSDTRRRAAGVEFEARSWLLAHYILGAGERRRKLGTFLNAVHQGAEPAAALRDAFGLDVGDASTALWRYRLQRAEVMRVEQPPGPRPEIAITTMSATSGGFMLADAALKACPAPAQGEALLRTLTADAGAVPNVEAGQLAVNRARVDWGDPAAALPWLEKTARRADAGADVLLLLARAHLKLAARLDAGARAPHLGAARAGIARARERDPGAGAVALAALDLSLLADGKPSPEALDGVLTAWRTGRDSRTLARAAVLASCYQVDVPRAEHILRTLENDVRDPATAAWAAAFQRRLDGGLSLADIAAEMRLVPGVGGFSEWTIDQVSVMRDVEYNAGLEDARGFFEQQMQNPDPSKALLNPPTSR
ncbi:hypothetical protein GPY61_26480 [Massilia sp. NEAU-DD11]|uniref:Sel1 repeat family protein n=1 Tax=Massilia cellulosiltytica TaxID=2683234 RepID=A0A7X3G4D0_9BURK|nr:hypothetical protein [Telluria cellulosilytica]MVW63476.1 hypothetical protein [Telluria cellulosilytica]